MQHQTGQTAPAVTAGGPQRRRRPIGLSDVFLAPGRLLVRIFFPKLLDRYVLGELISPLLFGWALFLVLFVLSVNLFKLAQLASRGARIEAVLEMLGLQVVLASVYCIPMAVLLAGLLGFGRLSGDSELVATQACGVSNLRAIRIAFLVGVLLSFAGLAINEKVIPVAGRRFHLLETQVKAEIAGSVLDDQGEQKAFVIQEPDPERKGRLKTLVIARRLRPERPPHPATLDDVTYIGYEEGRWSHIIQAPRAEWQGATKWVFYDPEVQVRKEATHGNTITNQSKTMTVKLVKTPSQMLRDQKDADQMNYAELSEYIEVLKKRKVRDRIIREFEVERERKLAIPFAAAVLALIGAPLGIRKHRSTAGVGIGLSLFIIILYYVGMGFLGVLGEYGKVTPLVAAWGCNVAGLIAGLYLTWRRSS